MKKKSFFLTIAWLLAGVIAGQNYRDDILAMNKMLLSQKNYSLQLRYDLFVDGNLSAPYEQQDVKIVRQGSNLYMKQGAELEVVETKNYRILINHGNKVFSALNKKEETESYTIRKDASELVGLYADSIVSVFKNVKVLREDAHTIVYECTMKPENAVAMVWVEMDKKLKMYRSLTTRYRRQRKIRELDGRLHTVTVKVYYNGFSASPAIPPTLFSDASYLVLKNGQVQGPAKRFATYNYFK